jgi:hypothetical protein
MFEQSNLSVAALCLAFLLGALAGGIFMSLDKGVRLVIVRTSFRILVLVCLCGFVLRTYWQADDPKYGWTRMIFFGSAWAERSLPRLQRTRHYQSTVPGDTNGYDGQFYAQMAIDPSLRDPAFQHATDGPGYRGRRIGLPALCFAVGWGKPKRILQVYALANLLFWFLLLGVLLVLFRPWTGQQVLGLSAALLSDGVTISMSRALLDLPATALIFLGLVLGAWWKAGLFAFALLTRESSLFAVLGGVDWRHPWQDTDWKRVLGQLVVAATPFALWLVYLHYLFPQGQTGGPGVYAWPGSAMFEAGRNAIHRCLTEGLYLPGQPQVEPLREHPLAWLYASSNVHQILGSLGLLTQVVYLWCRRDLDSPIWRIGICYTGLWAVMGSAIWSDITQVDRILLPMTVCFYLRLSGERASWFWPCFVLGSLSIPWGVRDFWLFP